MKDIMNIQGEKYYGRTSLWINGTGKKCGIMCGVQNKYVPQVRSQLEGHLKSTRSETSVRVGISTNIF